MNGRFVSLVLALLACAPLAGAAAAGSRHVVVVVFDGMRPDFVTAETTPNLWALAQRGVFFASHHPVYLSATEVNGVAMATGTYGARSLVIANTDYRPLIDPQKSVGIEKPENVRKGDEMSGGHYLAVPTVAEILHAHGLATAIAGAKQVALLHDRAVRAGGPGVSPVLYEGAVMPSSLGSALDSMLGTFPAVAADENKMARDAWTTRALIGTLWKDAVPAYSLLWLAEPDASQHATGPGTTQALAAIKSSDTNLGLVLAELEKRGLRDSTDVLVVSDHGFSTISRKVDVAGELSKAGLDAKREVPGRLQPGEVLAVSNGGSTLLYVGGHDAAVCRRLVATLQEQDWTGVIFAREPAEGTFPLSEAHIDSPQAADFVVALRWDREKNSNGTAGRIVSDFASATAKLGNHASLSAYDMHNTLVAAGPGFRRGVSNPLPSANLDLAPTILWLLGLRDEAAKMDGRVLGEALSGDAPPLKTFELKRLTSRRETAAGTWEQYLQVSEVNGVRYLDEGNGALQPR